MRKIVLGAAVSAAVVAGQAMPALADTVPEWDQVSMQTSWGNYASGSIYWRSARSASGTVRVYNNLYDNQCVALHDRVMTSATWSSWRHIGTVCTQSSYAFAVSRNPTWNMQYWQFRIKETVTELKAYDSNRPGYD